MTFKSILDEMDDAISKESVPQEVLNATKQAIDELGKVYLDSVDSSFKGGLSKKSTEELSSLVKSIDDKIAQSINNLKKVGVSINLKLPDEDRMNTHAVYKGQRSFGWDIKSYVSLSNLERSFDSALRVKAEVLEELGVRSGDEKSLEGRRKRDKDAEAYRDYYASKEPGAYTGD